MACACAHTNKFVITYLFFFSAHPRICVNTRTQTAMVRFLFFALCFATLINEAALTRNLGTATIMEETLSIYVPAVPHARLSVAPPPDCEGARQPGYKFAIKVEFIVCLFFVFLGVLHLRRKHKKLAYCLDIVSSVYLLWTTFVQHVYLHDTQVARWAIDICSAITSERGLIKDYLFVSIASWISSLFLELTSSARFVKLSGNLVPSGLHPAARWSRTRKVVLLTASFCTVNSVLFTMMLWGAVKQSLTNVSDDASVFLIQDLAYFTRFTRQCIEGTILIVGIATRDIRWRSTNSEIVRIAFSSFVFFVHSFVLLDAFIKQKAQFKGVEHHAVFISVFADVCFRLVVCVWALRNSLFGNVPRPHQPENGRSPHTPHVMPDHHCFQCVLLANRHLTPTPPQLTFQPFPEPSPIDTAPPLPSPSVEAVDYSDPVSVGGPFHRCRLETDPQQETR